MFFFSYLCLIDLIYRAEMWRIVWRPSAGCCCCPGTPAPIWNSIAWSPGWLLPTIWCDEVDEDDMVSLFRLLSVTLEGVVTWGPSLDGAGMTPPVSSTCKYPSNNFPKVTFKIVMFETDVHVFQLEKYCQSIPFSLSFNEATCSAQRWIENNQKLISSFGNAQTPHFLCVTPTGSTIEFYRIDKILISTQQWDRRLGWSALYLAYSLRPIYIYINMIFEIAIYNNKKDQLLLFFYFSALSSW